MKNLLCMLIVCVPLLVRAEVRTWTSNSGKTIEAEYGGTSSGKVRLLLNGREGRIPFAQLSEEDQTYIKEVEAARPGQPGSTRSDRRAGTKGCASNLATLPGGER